MIFGSYYYCSNGFYQDWYRAMVEARNRAEHRAFVHSLVRRNQVEKPTPKSISVLTRAINRPRLRANIRQPAWRAGRWKSLT